MDNDFENNAAQPKGRLTVFGHDEWFITNPKIEVYFNNVLLGTVSRDEVKTFNVNYPGVVRFKYSFRSAQIEMNSAKMSVQLSWNRATGALIAEKTFREAPAKREDSDISPATDDEGEITKESTNTKRSNNHYGLIAVIIIIAFIGVLIAISNIGKKTPSAEPQKIATPTVTEAAVKAEADMVEENPYIVAADNDTGAEFSITLNEYLEQLNNVEKEYGFQKKYSRANLKSNGTEQAKNTQLTIYTLDVGRTENTALICVRVNRETNRVACVDLAIDSAAIITENYYDSKKPDVNFYFDLAFRWVDDKFDVISIHHTGANLLKYMTDESIVTDEREGDFIIVTEQHKEHYTDHPTFRYRISPWLESLVKYK